MVDVVGIEPDVPVLKRQRAHARPAASDEAKGRALCQYDDPGGSPGPSLHLRDGQAGNVELLLELRAVRAVEDERAIVVCNANVQLPVACSTEERDVDQRSGTGALFFPDYPYTTALCSKDNCAEAPASHRPRRM